MFRAGLEVVGELLGETLGVGAEAGELEELGLHGLMEGQHLVLQKVERQRHQAEVGSRQFVTNQECGR